MNHLQLLLVVVFMFSSSIPTTTFSQTAEVGTDSSEYSEPLNPINNRLHNPVKISFIKPKPDSPFALTYRPNKPRQTFWPQLGSFFLPGFDQWWEGQYLAAGIYTGSYWSAQAIASRWSDSVKQKDKENNDVYYDRVKHGFSERAYSLSAQTAQAMGGFSAYHSFRSAVRSRQALGQYQFLKHEESVPELLAAAFNFSYLTRVSTWVPLSIIAVGMAASQFAIHDENQKKDSEIEPNKISGQDLGFATAFSFNAGTHEEALFRGWLLPLLRENTGNFWLANLSQATLFALAHTDVNLPIVQFAGGIHLGYVTRKNEWKIGEDVFIHFWWNVFAFIEEYSYQRKQDEASRAPAWLPPVTFNF